MDNNSSSQPTFSSKHFKAILFLPAKFEIRFLIFTVHSLLFRVEPTAVPWFRDFQNSGFVENLHLMNLANAVQPSLLMPVSDFYRGIPFESALMTYGDEDHLAQNRQIKKTTIVLTYTKPTTEVETTTKTQTIQVSNCTPVPFPYDVCV